MAGAELTTDRLRLRQWRDSDRAPFAAINADPEVTRYLNGTRDRAESDALMDRFIAHWAEHGFGLWALERASDRRFIGYAGLWKPAFDAHFMPAVEVGWRLARDAWGFGYATEAARATVGFGFETLGLHEIVSFTVPANVRSRRVMERLGMHCDPADSFDHPRLPPGNPLRRHVLYRLRRDEWVGPTAGG